MVVGNGHAREREITTAAGRVVVTAPRGDDRRDGIESTFATVRLRQRTTKGPCCPTRGWR
jgi:hypothetical protein